MSYVDFLGMLGNANRNNVCVLTFKLKLSRISGWCVHEDFNSEANVFVNLKFPTNL